MRGLSSPVPPVGGVPIPPAALAATYPLRCFAPQWARFDNRPTSGGGFKRRGPKPPPLSLQGVRILKERGKFEIPLSLSGVLWLLSFDMKRKQLAPAGATPAYPRAKGSLDRRSKWFSLVPFFLQKKKGTRAGARNAPSPARRRRPPYPGGISRHLPIAVLRAAMGAI